MCIHDPKRKRCWFALKDERTAGRFVQKFCEVVSALVGKGAIRAVTFAETQMIVTPAMIEAAEIVMNAPLRRSKINRPKTPATKVP